MITRRVRIQLAIFVVITLVGVSYTGARYAKLTRFIHSTSYTVAAKFQNSGGIFTGAEVDYRGVEVGRVSKMELSKSGVTVYLQIDNKHNDIPADTMAVVGDRSAVGEQFVDLEPKTDSKPYLTSDSVIPLADTSIPIQTDTLLSHLAETVGSVPKKALRTTVLELGKAFAGTGPDLQTIIDAGTSFIKAANANFDTTTKLIADSNTVLDTQIASEGAIRNFSRNLDLFSTTLAGSNPDLKRIIDDGPGAVSQLQSFIQENRIDLGQLLSELVTTGKIIVKNLPGIRQILVLYPYVVEGGFTVVSKSPDTGLYDAHFGLILTDHKLCTNGYNTKQRPPQDRKILPMNVDAHCSDPATADNPRGAQNAPDNRAPALASPTVASYDPSTGKLDWNARRAASLASTGTVAPPSLGEGSWKWLFLQPMMGQQTQ